MWGYCMVPSLKEHTIAGTQFTGTFRISIEISLLEFLACKSAAAIAKMVAKIITIFLLINKLIKGQ